MKILKTAWLFIKLLILGYLIFWFMNRPGTVNIQWQGWIIETSVGFIIACITVITAVIAVLYHWWRHLISLPKAWRNYHQEQQKNKGFQAVTRGLLAVAAGDQLTASRQAKRADHLLSDKPLTKLLNAQAALMEGDEAKARHHFTSLLEDPEGSFFGIRGLLTNALSKGHKDEALNMARKAYEKEPKRGWIIRVLFDLETQAKNWQKAQELIPKALKYDAMTKQEVNQNQAALWIAQSIEIEEDILDEAIKLATKAYHKSNHFIPAIIHLARLYLKNDQNKKAEKLLLKSWKNTPHPDLAQLWMNMSKNRLPLDQVKWAEKLIRNAPNHIESRLILAQTAMQASLWGVARTQLLSAKRENPSKRVYQMLARLEKKEKQDEKSARQWLEKRDNASQDKTWICESTGAIMDQWYPICPINGTFNTIRWSHPDQNLNAKDLVGQDNIIPLSVLENNIV